MRTSLSFSVSFPPIADISATRQNLRIRNVQVIDGALNATFSVFQATEEEFAIIFPDGREMEIADDLIERVGHEEANRALLALWERPIRKRDAVGIHGTLFYDAEERREFMPPSMRETDWDERFVNEAQRKLFRQHR